MYLSIQEIHDRKEPIQAAVQSLLINKALAAKPRAKQWRFFKDAVQRLFDTDSISNLDRLPPVQAAQLKYEVEDRLRRFYLRPGQPVDYVFSLVHWASIDGYLQGRAQCYPQFSGYCILVRELRGEFEAQSLNQEEQKKYIERVIGEAIDAEFRAYQALPSIDPLLLSPWFYPDSPAINEILNILYRHQKKRWIVSNTFNPSTKRVMKLKVNKIGQDEAVVSTMEYWYLRWWAVDQDSYVYPYRETNRQVYFLRKHDGLWKVFENIRPAPRASTPHRRRHA